MCGLGYLKLRDVETFSTMFLNYDLLARRWVPIQLRVPLRRDRCRSADDPGRAQPRCRCPVALFIGTIGAVSVLKAVYIDKRELKCACVGGEQPRPARLRLVHRERAMVAMAIWMGTKHLL